MIKNFTLICICMMALYSCSLDKEPETTLTDATFWKSETDLRGACNRLYIDLPGFIQTGGTDLRSDEAVMLTPTPISSGNWSVPEKADEWTGNYNKIGVCNNIIVKGDKASVKEEVKNRWLAEAHFFRAFYYFDLVKKYGDVPLILQIFENTTDSGIKKGRDSREKVIQQCYTDLEFASQHLPDIDDLSDANNWGRVSRSAALAMLVRIGLYEGTYIKYHRLLEGDYEEHLKKAIDAAETMIYKEKKHELYPDFQKLFYFDGEGRQNKENILVKVYGPNGATNAILTHNQSAMKANGATITRQMIDNFLYVDGLPWDKTNLAIKPETQYDDIFKNRDPRLGMSVFRYQELSYKGALYRPFDDTNHNGAGYPIKKGYMNNEFNTNNKETVDKMIIRYAEVLLSYAEALYELNGAISNMKLNETVNEVRRRSGFMASLTNEFAQANGLCVRDEIRRERMVEFLCEDMHYDDIIRWKTAENVLPKPLIGLLFNSSESIKSFEEIGNKLTDSEGFYNGVKVYRQANFYVLEEASTRSFNPGRDYLYPIPSYEIATSEGNIKQNPNW